MSMRVYPKAILLLSLLVTPLAAAETPWQTVAPGVTMRLVSAGTVTPDGTSWVGVVLNIPET